MRRFLFILGLFFLTGSFLAAGKDDIPKRPEQLTFPPLTFNVPDAGPMRVVLDNKVPAYILEDRELPLVTVDIFFRGGSYLEPEGQEGLADLTETVWRSGGAGDLDAEGLDEELAFLAANLSVGIGGTSGSVTLNLLSKDLDRGLQLLMDVLQHPRFQESRLLKAREDLLAAIRRRNDSSASIEAREWNRLIYGPDYWINRLATKASIDGITRQDLVSFQQRLANPANIVLAVSGDFSRPEMIEKLNATFGKWQASGSALPPVPQPDYLPRPGVYLVNKPDVNQGRVSMGHIGLKRPVPDEFALELANDVLGGGGFTSWILSQVRSDKGLAYSAGSSYRVGDTIPGTFRISFQSKSSTCAEAARTSLDLVQKLLSSGISADELKTSQNSFIQTFPNSFQTRSQTVSLFARDELVGRSHDFWTTYRDKVRSVGLGDIQKTARRYIHPAQFVILVVGNIDEILKGHPDYPDARFQNFGPLIRVPLRDPMTLQPIEK